MSIEYLIIGICGFVTTISLIATISAYYSKRKSEMDKMSNLLPRARITRHICEIDERYAIFVGREGALVGKLSSDSEDIGNVVLDSFGLLLEVVIRITNENQIEVINNER
ncbi:hypothetical protein KY334_00890 [Candidatus Woesearchaeota archaeon]|nr:hypothetical protein [Candidatus Woesearchaeota archaeon]